MSFLSPEAFPNRFALVRAQLHNWLHRRTRHHIEFCSTEGNVDLLPGTLLACNFRGQLAAQVRLVVVFSCS
jgi:hypothetical protein